MRRLLAGVGLVALAPAVGTAQQQTVSFALGSDSALTILTGQTQTVQLVVSGTGGVSAYSVTVLLDRSRVDITAVDTVTASGLPAPTLSFGTDAVTLTASGAGSTSSSVAVARVTFSMAAGATQGSLVSLRLNALTRATDGGNGVPDHRTGLLQVCQASRVRGDVTGERVVNSRDALIVLTAAVGLPTGAYDPSSGDGDEDGAVTSRDALFILSYGIGVYTGQPHMGMGITNACGPLLGAPTDLVFYRSGALYRVSPGDTLARPVFAPTAGYNYYAPRWSPDRSRILYTAYAGAFYYDLVSADTLGTVVDTLVRNASYDVGGDWSPDGSRIAFVSNRVSPPSLFVMDANGANQVQITANLTVNTSEAVSWSPDGTRIAFVACQTCTYYGIWVVAPDGSGLTAVLPETAAQSPLAPVWNATSDSIAYTNSSASYVYRVPALAASIGGPAPRLSGNTYYPAAASTGLGFQGTFRYPYDFFLTRATDGRTFRVMRGDLGNDQRYSFRRTGVYVDTVTVTPADSVHVPLSGTQQFTAVVHNNDGSPNSAPVRWISRDPAAVTIDGQTGLATAVGTTSGVYVIGTVGGWRSDSTRVIVP